MNQDLFFSVVSDAFTWRLFHSSLSPPNTMLPITQTHRYNQPRDKKKKTLTENFASFRELLPQCSH